MRADFTFVRFSLLCILTAGSQVSKLQSKKNPGGAHPLVSRSREGRQIPASRHVSVVWGVERQHPLLAIPSNGCWCCDTPGAISAGVLQQMSGKLRRKDTSHSRSSMETGSSPSSRLLLSCFLGHHPIYDFPPKDPSLQPRSQDTLPIHIRKIQ